MPYLHIQTNLSIDQSTVDSLIQRASELVAEHLHKPENYVMVAVSQRQTMMFAASTEPLAYLELKSIGLPTNSTAGLSNVLCTLINSTIGVEKSRIYIEFANAERQMWGWNSKTF